MLGMACITQTKTCHQTMLGSWHGLYNTKANLAFKYPQREQKAKELNSKKSRDVQKGKGKHKANHANTFVCRGLGTFCLRQHAHRSQHTQRKSQSKILCVLTEFSYETSRHVFTVGRSSRGFLLTCQLLQRILTQKSVADEKSF